jgi:hypothetical protein
VASLPVFAIVICSVLAVIGALGTWRAARLWRDPRLASAAELSTRVLPVSQRTRAGVVAGSVPLNVGLMLIGIGLVIFELSHPVPKHANAGALTGVVVAGIGFLALVCHFSIVRFRQPAFLIPPHLRGARPGRRG